MGESWSVQGNQVLNRLLLIPCEVQKNRANIFYLFEANVQKYGDLEFIWSRSGCYTWKETFTRACQYGNYFLSLGVKPGDNVAIYLQNAPEFMFVWYGLISIGCTAAFVNYNIASDALVHCIKVSGAKILIADNDTGCKERLQGSMDRIISELGIKPITLSEDLKISIAISDPKRPSDSLREAVGQKSNLCLIYTRYSTYWILVTQIAYYSTAELQAFLRLSLFKCKGLTLGIQ